MMRSDPRGAATGLLAKLRRRRGSLVVVAALMLLGRAAAFERALPGYEYAFPRDHFEHREFEIEWWYYTGALETAEGRRFGFELTFFRTALERTAPARSPWDVDQLYLAHLTLTDVAGDRFFQDERLNRAGPGIAGASQPRTWNGNWQARWLDPANPLGAITVQATSAGFSFDLRLEPARAPVVHGKNGVSQKAAGEGRASHYVSYTRLETSGTLAIGGEDFEVTGRTWMDHEFSTDSLGEGQVGWDWMSMMFDDGSELMLYRMRRDDGSTDVHSSGTYVAADGTVTHLTADEYRMTPGRKWKSPATGADYPIEWRVEVPALGIALDVTTPVEGQEVVATRGGPSYWEGLVDYRGRGRRGVGYLEMTGYDRPLRLGVD